MKIIISLILLLLATATTITKSQGIPDNDPELCVQRIKREDCPETPSSWGKFDEDDVIDVYYLQAPIFEGMFGNFFGRLGGYHSAVGFYDITTGQNYTAEYDAYYEVGNGTLPNIIDVNGTKEILWCNAGILCSIPFVNETYWDPKYFSTASKTFMATINGTQLNQYIEWMESYNTTNPIYQTWDVWNNYGKDLYVPSTTCDDFTAASFDFLYTAGARYNCSTVFKRDYVNLFSEKPEPVVFTEHRDEIIRFYESLMDRSGSILDIIERIIGIVGLNKYLYYQGDYYLLKLNWPFMGVKYDYAPVAGCPLPETINEQTSNIIHMRNY
ncbi:hypothetical protein DICPUDRAFT_50132 [Dictyostelium purpureum]|uniref:Ceroid-lipofuscinosis neuronal protein 5 n=1 Tax=Dictyostelium purpureum TaxID=5786 RepID=F0ZWX7_DICPU|nr:uncharacterized protein DICPUDRAFT_50132 [Dictyostelium purpureum]EGC31548.1 hypothetical protein DICPUDRAFT_50132 [Dictyostelium purpureum]|eukprot:XP_003291919.1 hypothetical protein DICPUDRAFT_50132 [Dictyostelium purpureum]